MAVRSPFIPLLFSRHFPSTSLTSVPVLPWIIAWPCARSVGHLVGVVVLTIARSRRRSGVGTLPVAFRFLLCVRLLLLMLRRPISLSNRYEPFVTGVTRPSLGITLVALVSRIYFLRLGGFVPCFRTGLALAFLASFVVTACPRFVAAIRRIFATSFRL